MLEPSDRAKIAMMSLRKDADFIEIVGWLKEELVRCEKQSPKLVEDYKYRWNQGNQQILKALVETIDNIEKIVRNPLKGRK